MATKPTDIPFWATANPVDGVSGQPAILTPAAGKVASGYIRLERPPRQDFNYNQNLNGLWVEWLDQQTDLNDAHRLTVIGNPHDVLATQISDFDTEVANNSSVVLNTTHRSSDGTDHSDVVSNTAEIDDLNLTVVHKTGATLDITLVNGPPGGEGTWADGGLQQIWYHRLSSDYWGTHIIIDGTISTNTADFIVLRMDTLIPEIGLTGTLKINQLCLADIAGIEEVAVVAVQSGGGGLWDIIVERLNGSPWPVGNIQIDISVAAPQI